MWNKDLSMKIEFYHSDFTTSGTKRNEKKDMDASKKIIYIFQNKNNFLKKAFSVCSFVRTKIH